MSEWREMSVEFKDDQCLIDALKDQGYEVEVHEEPVKLNNSYSSQEKKAHIVVRKGSLNSCYGDLGFEKTDKGMKMHVDETDYREGSRDKIKLGRVKQCYSDRLITKEVKKRPGKFSIKSRRVVDGDIKIVVRRL